MGPMQTQRKERPNQANQQEMLRQLGHKNETVAKPQTSETPTKPQIGMMYGHMMIGFK